MKQIFLILITLQLTTCESIQYDGERRLVFQTTVVDAEGVPLPDSHVEMRTSSAYSTDLISKGKTNDNGEITLIFPRPEEGVSLNVKLYNDDASYMNRSVLNLSREDFVNYKLVYPNAYLLKSDEVATLNMTYNQINFNVTLKKVTIQGVYQLPQEYYEYYEDDYYFAPNQFLVKKNQSFQLKYTLLNLQTNIETEQFVNLQIGNDPIDYTLNY